MKARLPAGYGGGMNSMMKQAQKMQEDMAALQEELKTREYEASAGGSMVTAHVNGERRVTSIEIKPEVVDPDDIEMLADLVTAAVNEALEKAETDSSNEMSKITGGFDIPGMI